MNNLCRWLNELWDRFWLYQFRNLCPEPTEEAKLLIAFHDVKVELGEALLPALDTILYLIEYAEREGSRE